MKNNINNIYRTIYGLNNSINFLKNHQKYKISSISINKEGVASKNKELNALLKSMGVSIKLLENQKFNAKYNFKHHQGIVVHFEGKITSELNEISNFKENACYIICDQITDPQNLGQIIRTSECAGIDGIILPKHGSVHITDSVIQVSQGAFFNLDVFIETNLNNTIKYLKSEGFWIVGVENGIDAEMWYNIDYKGKIIIIVGSEGAGMRKLIKKSCDFLTTIPMKGKINSLNVSAALSAILFERQRQLEVSE